MRNFLLKRNSGQIGMIPLIGWGITIAMASIGFSYGRIEKISDAQTKLVEDVSKTDAIFTGRISVVETKSSQYEKDIDQINTKLDTILRQLK